MKHILIFGGTTEARRLAAELAGRGFGVTVSVASEYGRDMLADTGPAIRVHTGALDEDEMVDWMKAGGFDGVVDATHPYARQASRHILAAAQAAGLAHHRLLRPPNEVEGESIFPDLQAACRFLAGTEGPILAATGSRELERYTAIPGFAGRVYPRVLPMEESIRKCLELGFGRGHIIAMQGPFSEGLNLALLRQFSIRWMVTKDGGAEGGFEEKLRAAKAAGVGLLVVARPEEPVRGYPYEEILARLTRAQDGPD